MCALPFILLPVFFADLRQSVLQTFFAAAILQSLNIFRFVVSLFRLIIPNADGFKSNSRNIFSHFRFRVLAAESRARPAGGAAGEWAV